jgi:xanthine phosphoribosyltransferase
MARFRDDVRNQPVTWADVHRDAKALVRLLLPRAPFRGIVALTRGGLVPAAIVAREMGLHVVDTLCIRAYDGQVREAAVVLKTPEAAREGGGAGWLLIDDLVDTGATARAARAVLPAAHFAAVYAKPEGRPHVDTFVREIPQDVWIFFPWDTEPQYVKPLAESAERA